MNTFSPPQDSATRGVLDNHMSIQAAAEYSGYNLQYLRRIVRKGEVEGVKDVEVDLHTGQATFDNDGAIDMDAVKFAIEKAGYTLG